jgi:capsular polysaccharide biosynthesis protein
MNTAVVEYGRVLRARWRWIMWGVVLALAATTLFLFLWPPMYRSEATVFVRTPGDVSRVLDGGDSYAQGRARTYAALASSTSVAARVIADLGLDLQPEVLSRRIQATSPPGTALIDIAVSAPSAAEAQRTATVLLSEYAATVRTLESVPGSLVPRAELVVVDPPGRPVRVVAWGASIPVVLLCAALIGLLLGSLGAVLRSIFEPPTRDPAHARRSAELDERAPAYDHRVLMAMGDLDLPGDAMPTGSGTDRHHRPSRRILTPSRKRRT